MAKLFLSLVLAASAFAQYKMEPVAAAPAGLAPELAAAIEPAGYRVVSAAGSPVCEIWFAKSLPSQPKSTEDGVTLPTLPHGTLLGVVNMPAAGADRRGQLLKPGLYTLRYSIYPQDGNHIGAAPQRDFALLVPAAEDKDPAARPTYEQLMPMSTKASGTPHPAVLGIYPSSSEKLPSFAKEGERDWVLNVKVGGTPLAVILVGRAE